MIITSFFDAMMEKQTLKETKRHKKHHDGTLTMLMPWCWNIRDSGNILSTKKSTFVDVIGALW